MHSEPDNKIVLSQTIWKVLRLERLDLIRIRIYQQKDVFKPLKKTDQ